MVRVIEVLDRYQSFMCYLILVALTFQPKSVFFLLTRKHGLFINYLLLLKENCKIYKICKQVIESYFLYHVVFNLIEYKDITMSI